MRTACCYADGAWQPDYPVERIGEALANPAWLLWLDIEEPTAVDAAFLSEVFAFHPLAIEDALRAHERPKVDTYSARVFPGADSDHALPTGRKVLADEAHLGIYYFVVFYSATYRRPESTLHVHPLSMFIGPNYLVTIHPDPIVQVVQTRQRVLSPRALIDHRVGGLVHALLDAIVDDYFPLMDVIAEHADELEDRIFTSSDEATIEDVFDLRRELLKLRQLFGPERDVVNVLLRRELPIFRSKDVAYLQDVYDHLVRLVDMVDIYRDMASSALDGYLSIQSNNLNQIVKALTIASILLMSASLIAGIYGMNFRYMPELQWRWGYPWALGLMGAVMLGLVLFFKRRKWF